VKWRQQVGKRISFKADGFSPYVFQQPKQLCPELLRGAESLSLILLSWDTKRLTCEDDQPKAPLGVSKHTAPQQHVLVAQGEFVFLPVEGSTEFVQLVVGRFTDHFT
jgi:hypothetical protein